METKHIHELNPKRTLISIILFIVIIVIGLLTLKTPKLKYFLSPQRTIALTTDTSDFMYPYELEGILTGSVDTVVLIDIRDRFEYGRGHIPGAENISALEMLNDENIEHLQQLKKNGFMVVIYANDQLRANGPWLVFRQLGFSNVKVLLGGYDYYNKWKDRLGETYFEEGFLKGVADYNYAEVASSNANAVPALTDQPAVISVKRKKRTTAVSGGC